MSDSKPATVADVQKFFNLDTDGTRIQKHIVVDGNLVAAGSRTLKEFGDEWTKSGLPADVKAAIQQGIGDGTYTYA